MCYLLQSEYITSTINRTDVPGVACQVCQHNGQSYPVHTMATQSIPWTMAALAQQKPPAPVMSVH